MPSEGQDGCELVKSHEAGEKRTSAQVGRRAIPPHLQEQTAGDLVKWKTLSAAFAEVASRQYLMMRKKLSQMTLGLLLLVFCSSISAQQSAPSMLAHETAPRTSTGIASPYTLNSSPYIASNASIISVVESLPPLAQPLLQRRLSSRTSSTLKRNFAKRWFSFPSNATWSCKLSDPPAK